MPSPFATNSVSIQFLDHPIFLKKRCTEMEVDAVARQKLYVAHIFLARLGCLAVCDVFERY
jgi:hypothetical protein